MTNTVFVVCAAARMEHLKLSLGEEDDATNPC